MVGLLGMSSAAEIGQSGRGLSSLIEPFPRIERRASGRRIPGRATAACPSRPSCTPATSGPSTPASPTLAVPGLDRNEPRADPHLLRRAALRGGPSHVSRLQTPDRIAGHRDLRRVRRAPRRDRLRQLAPCASPGPAPDAHRAEPGASRQDLGRRRVLVLGAARPAQAALRRPPRRPHRRAAVQHGRDAGRDPGAPATRRQHRHDRARHGQLRPLRAAPRCPARRLAQREGAHRRLRRQLHRRCGARPIPRSRTASPACIWVCATTARQRDLAKPVLTPEQAVAEMRRRIGEGQRCGILFGPERNGLETEEVANADAVVMAPVNPNFASLNLAQAVLLLSYEWIKQANAGTLGRVTTYEAPVQPGLRTRGSPPATREELISLLRAHRVGARRERLFHRARKAPQRRAKPPRHAHADGRDGTRNPHLAGNREGADRRQAPQARIAIVMPRFPSSDARQRGTWHCPTRTMQSAG